MDFNFDITAIGIIISVLFTIFFTKGFVSGTVDNILIVIKGIYSFETNKIIREQLTDEVVTKVSIIDSADSLDTLYSDMNRSLQCNVTLFFWYLTFVAVLVVLDKLNIIKSIAPIHILTSLIYMMLLPYIFRKIWEKLDYKNDGSESFLNSVQNKISAIRYPITYFIGLITFPFLFMDYVRLWSILTKEDVVRGIFYIALPLLCLYFIIYVSFRLYRVFSLNKHEYVDPLENFGLMYFLGINNEIKALYLSVIFSAALAFLALYIGHTFKFSTGVTYFFMYTLPLLTLVAPLVTFKRLFEFNTFWSFLKNT